MKIRALALVVGLVLGSCREGGKEGEASPKAVEPPVASEKAGAGTATKDEGWVPLAPEGDAQWQGQPNGGTVSWQDGVLRLEWGEMLTAAKWSGPGPKQAPYEVEWQARRVDGTDFFSALTLPVRAPEECVTWVTGGWGGGVVGISSVDGEDAARNETKANRSFETGRWYSFRLRVERERIQGWIDGEPVTDLALGGKKLSLRAGPIEVCAPFGVASWQSTGELRGLRWRPVK